MFSRIDPYRLTFSSPLFSDITLFASAQVPFDAAATRELRQMLELQNTLQRWQQVLPDSTREQMALLKVVLTPDFHKARGIPVGTVLQTRDVLLPQAIGNDIGCGMRLHTTSLTAEQVLGQQKELVPIFRRMFFEAGRNIPMNRLQREALLREGLLGLLEATPSSLQAGLWQEVQDQNLLQDIEHTERLGSLPASSTPGLEDFLGSDTLTRDGQVGSLGGGNHFVEIQRVARILDPQRAHQWNLRENQVVVMVHSGSVSVGHSSASVIREEVSSLYPACLGKPANGIFPVPFSEAHVQQTAQIWDALHNAANFATANRMMLALMVQKVFRQQGLETDFPLLYDAPHNMIWQEDQTILHRKGATPARGWMDLQHTPFAGTGEPVLVPGSMGSSSFVLAGLGLQDALNSASHGAGRVLSRGQAMQQPEGRLSELLDQQRIVTPLDLVRARPDIAREKRRELLQEAPQAYKNIQAIMDTLQGAQMALVVAELEPLITIKG
ncbi:RtcB family protein [Deinococcus roseus]|uniref:tRNA-splicing ligase RtcB n=1 Tax=Deinococcus roseus TaxID=392414 RepID=A0ABQ2DEH1_9DEIO|nr:RtcB family protein [Deinococcus roseus]GGJ53055.1 RNA-splicing ligase RtcB [Deinococcus roseus]